MYRRLATQAETDGIHNRRFACAVGADDEIQTTARLEDDIVMSHEVLQMHAHDRTSFVLLILHRLISDDSTYQSEINIGCE